MALNALEAKRKRTCDDVLCLEHGQAVREAPDYGKGTGHKMKALRSSWGGKRRRGEMKSSCLRSYSLQSIGDCGETLELNPPCCTQRSEVLGFRRWFLASQISRRDWGWRS